MFQPLRGWDIRTTITAICACHEGLRIRADHPRLPETPRGASRRNTAFEEEKVHASWRHKLVQGLANLDHPWMGSTALFLVACQICAQHDTGRESARARAICRAKSLVQRRLGAKLEDRAWGLLGKKLVASPLPKELVIAEVRAQGIAVAKVVPVQVHLGVGIVPPRHHSHRIDDVSAGRCARYHLDIAAPLLTIETGKYAGEGHDVVVVVSGHRVARTIQDPGSILIQLDGANGEQLHYLAGIVLVRVILVVIKGRVSEE
mmetsp:Transcript_33284/g.79808  ORF Transcript_33284/g.79808 Transcript_33284/m.79808 type:complete len:261 (+) Transcript_33284:2889-3671(+)